MSSNWFTEAESSGTLTVEKRDGSWYVASPGSVGPTKCLFDFEVDGGTGAVRDVEATVTRFQRAVGSRDNYLFLGAPEDGGTDGTSGDAETPVTSDGDRSDSSPSSVRALKDFTGSGDYVDVEATVDAVFFVKKDVSGMPDVKGELVDENSWRPVPFVVGDGVSHPYLAEGKRFRFENVKDHYYKQNDEIQVVIGDNTNFVELD